jgi:hypothetical protein
VFVKRFLLPAVLIGVIALLLAVIGVLVRNKIPAIALPEIISEKSDISAHTVVKEVLPIGEYACLAYHYTSVVKDVNTKDIRGWNIPFTTRKYIFTYDGIMKLGIDGNKIRVEEEPSRAAVPKGPETAPGGPDLPVIRIFLPPVQILSHEISEGSIEVFEQSQTIFNEIKIEDAFRVTADRKRELEAKVMASDVPNEARDSVEQQFGTLLKNLPGIRGAYAIEFTWQDSQAAGNQL